LSRATYLDVDRTTRELGRLTHEGSLWFWYAYKPNGDQHYTSFCSTYLWATTLLGRALPDVTDLRYDPLHAGTYVAVMDDRESAVNQGIALLRDHGATLEPVDRLRSSVRPNGFGIALLRVTRLELAPKVYTLSPSRDTVRPVAELLNYDLDGLLTHTGHAVYGKELAPPPGLPRGVFKVTDMKDHFGTNFQPISVQGSPPVTAVEVTAIDQATDDRFGSINMIFQDQDYRTLYSTGTLPRGEDRTLVALPAGTRTIRVAFLANDLGFIKFPKAVQLRAFANK
jgi:hypothetical protein